MADDTRQREDLSREALTVDKDRKAFSGEQWKDIKKNTDSPPARAVSANMLEGGTQNTAGGQIPEVSFWDAMPKTMAEFSELPQKPCVRDALLTGIGAGFAMGGVRAVWGAAIFNACSWAAATFCFGTIASREYCMYQRQVEKDGMMRAVEILNKKDIERKAREAFKEKQREEKRKTKEADLDLHYAKLREGKDAKSDDGGISKPWWKMW